MDSVVLSSRLERVQSDSDPRTEIPCNLPAALSSTNKAGCLFVCRRVRDQGQQLKLMKNAES